MEEDKKYPHNQIENCPCYPNCDQMMQNTMQPRSAQGPFWPPMPSQAAMRYGSPLNLLEGTHQSRMSSSYGVNTERSMNQNSFRQDDMPFQNWSNSNSQNMYNPMDGNIQNMQDELNAIMGNTPNNMSGNMQEMPRPINGNMQGMPDMMDDNMQGMPNMMDDNMQYLPNWMNDNMQNGMNENMQMSPGMMDSNLQMPSDNREWENPWSPFRSNMEMMPESQQGNGQNLMDSMNNNYIPTQRFGGQSENYQNITGTPYGNGMTERYQGEQEDIRDMERMKNMFPDIGIRIQILVEESCDDMDYEGSPMYDEQPDKIGLMGIVTQICDKVKIGMQLEEEEDKDDILAMNKESRRRYPPGKNWLRDFAEVMLYQEMFRRRCRHRNCRRW